MRSAENGGRPTQRNVYDAITEAREESARLLREFREENTKDHDEIKALQRVTNHRVGSLEQSKAYFLGALAIIGPTLGALLVLVIQHVKA